MSTTTLLTPRRGYFPSPTVRFLCQAWWTCYSTSPHTWRDRGDVLLATEAPLSVIPTAARHQLDLVIRPVQGWQDQVPTWFGIPCRIGRVMLWLPIEEGPEPYREFSLLVLLPNQALEDAPPFIFLGTQFLLEYQAQVVLDCSAVDRPGQLIIP